METLTYTVLNFRELEEMIEKELNIPIKRNSISTFDNFDIISDLECSNDSFHFFDKDPAGILQEDETWHSKTAHYVALLQQKGIIPQTHEILLEVSW